MYRSGNQRATLTEISVSTSLPASATEWNVMFQLDRFSLLAALATGINNPFTYQSCSTRGRFARTEASSHGSHADADSIRRLFLALSAPNNRWRLRTLDGTQCWPLRFLIYRDRD